MARGRTLTVHAWDPYHGDRNNRHPRLGSPVQRRVPADLWRTFHQTQPAIHNNGIFGWSTHIDVVDVMEHRRASKLRTVQHHAESAARRRASERGKERLLVLAERGAGWDAEDAELRTIIDVKEEAA